jgi:molybdate transport system substrate-binding protein
MNGSDRPVSAGIVTLIGAAIAMLALVTSCGSTGVAEGSSSGSAISTVTVSAASSLTDAFTELADDLMAEDPSLQIRLNFGSSGELAAQIRDGAPADVAAFANEEAMADLTSEGLTDVPTVFATNRLAMVTKPGNALGVDTLQDLSRITAEGGIVALCATTAPCGRFADEVLQRAGLSLPPERVTRATNARSTLTAVSEGDADAALVYVTDANSAGDSVEQVGISDLQNVVARYPIAMLSSSEVEGGAQIFIDRVLGAPGRQALERAGFGLP